MKRSRIIACFLCLLILAGCNGQEPNAGDDAPVVPYHESETFDESLSYDENGADGAIHEPDGVVENPEPEEIDIYYENELCHCGEHYRGEYLRDLTPPMNIREHYDMDFKLFDEAENIYSTTYIQWESEWTSALFIWTDEPVYNFSFVSLSWRHNEGEEFEFFTREILLNIDELLPSDIVILNVNFIHYLLPHGGLIFEDSNGELVRMYIIESMRGGCFPAYHLGFHNDDWADWID